MDFDHWIDLLLVIVILWRFVVSAERRCAMVLFDQSLTKLCSTCQNWHKSMSKVIEPAGYVVAPCLMHPKAEFKRGSETCDKWEKVKP